MVGGGGGGGVGGNYPGFQHYEYFDFTVFSFMFLFTEAYRGQVNTSLLSSYELKSRGIFFSDRMLLVG